MSIEYDNYLENHRKSVKQAYDWIRENLPDVAERADKSGHTGWHTEYAHDKSKDDPEEYAAYDAYFYGGNKSFRVVEDFNRAWLIHIHKNPHHWQYWVLIEDEGKVKALDMPYAYIVEMICDWWSFSWTWGDLHEIFNWYAEHEERMMLSPMTKGLVEDILKRIKIKLREESESSLQHHGIKGQQWGVRHGPPYPLKDHRKIAKLQNADGATVTPVDHVVLQGEPNSITQIVRKNGGVDRNYYDENGRQSKQVSNHDHGQPKKHPYGKHGEHAHDYIYDEDGNLINREPRDLNEQEKKENSDIL